MKPNQSIRDLIFKHNIKMWQVASLIGISSSYLSVLMREELSTDRKEQILEAIEQLSK